MENPPSKFFRLSPARRSACGTPTSSSASRRSKTPTAMSLNSTAPTTPPPRRRRHPTAARSKPPLHWVSAEHAVNAEVRLYDHLCRIEDLSDVPENEDWKTYLNPNSLETLTNCKLEPSLANAKPGDRVQFERLGYFVKDADSAPDQPVFNRSVTLKDTWAKIQKKG